MKQKDKRKKPDSVRLPEELKEAAIKRAKEENRTLSNLIITALKKYLGL
jgi:predicted HicB family RNase H-like nuclease